MRSIEEIKKQFPEREEQKKSNGSETKSFIGISPVQAAFSAYKKAAVQIEEEERRKRRATLTAIPDPTEKKKTYAEMLKERNAAAQKMEGEIPSYYKPKTSVQEIKNLIFGKPKAGGTANPTISAAEMNTRFDEMTEEQARAYSYYKNAGKAKEAKDYLKAIEPDINARAAAKRTEEAKALAEESTTGGLYARYMAGLTNPMGVIYGQMQNAKGEAIDPNSPYLIGQQIQEGQHAGFIGESTGAKRFAKEAAMGVFDFGTQAATLGGMGLSGKALGNATSALYGATAFSGNIKDAAERGATTGEAITYGTIGAAAEIITERLGFERLFRLGGIAANGAAMRRAIKAILPNMAAEGAEESLTEATNLVSDVFIMGDRSQMHRIYSEAKAAGMTEGEAAREAITAGLKQIGYAGAVGAASGGVIAGGVAGLSRAAGRNMLDGNTEENVENSVEDGENLLNAAENNTQEGENGTNLPESGANQQENGTNIPESGTNQQGRGTNADRATASAEYGERWFYEEGQRLLAEEEQRRGNVSFLPAFQTYYAAGLAGIAESEIRQTAETSAADRGLLTAAYMAGSRDRAADISARLKGTGKLGQTKGVFLETEAATEAQKAFAKLIAETSGAEVILVDHLENNANGLYRRGRGQMVIALDAESFTGTLAHESLHYIRETNPEGYARAQEAVFRMAAALEGKTTEDYISQYKRRYEGHVDTIGDVMEEMTADAFQRIAADEEGLRGLLREMEQSEPGILEKLKEFIDKLLETLEGLLGDQRFSEFADDIHKSAENTRKLQRIFAEEMKQSRNMQEGKAEARISESEAITENRSYLPEGETAEVEEVAFSFAGRRARNANITAKEKAEKMEAAGRSKEEIFHDTGWFRGADGEWRFEIDDSGFRFFPNGDANFANNENYQRYRKMWKEADFENKDFPMLDEIYGAELGREKKLLGFYIQHKALFENYPHLQHATFRYEEMQDGRRAYYNPERNEIVLDKGMQSEYTLEPAKMSVLHEIQHAIQNFEGFSRGTSLTEMSKTYGAENAYHSYRNAAGEIEARDTEARRNLTEEERREKFPDIGNEKTIYAETIWENFSLRENKEINYESLTAKPDMKKAGLDSNAMEGKTKRDILPMARESVRQRKHPKNTDTALFIRNMDTGKDILVAKKGIEHSLQRKWQETGIMLSGLGEMLENAVKINELEPREGVESAYILMGYGEDEKGSGYPAYFVINEYANGNIEMERVGALYAANAKKIEPAVNTAMDAGRNALLKSGSTISIEELLEKVNGIYSDILPADVAEKFRHGRRETKLGKDVRYSIREEEYQRILAENEQLAEANAALKRQFTITRDALHDPESARKAGRNFLKRYDSGFSLDEFTERFTGLCDYIAQNGDRVDAKKVMSALQKLAYEVISESRVLNKEASEEYRDLKNDLRKTKIKVTEDMVKEFDYYGGYNETRIRNFGKIGLSRQGGIAADTLYAELAERYPELFQEDFTGSEVDMIMDIIAVADSLDPVYENPYAMDMDEAALEASYELWDMYFDIQMQKPTFADRYEKKLEKERAKAKAARHYLREEIKERYEKKLEEAKKTELARLMGEGRKTAKEIARLRRELEAEKENVRERDEKISELKEWEALWAAAYREARREDKAAAKAEMKEKLKEERLAALIREGKKLEELRRKKDAQLERQAESHRRAMERQDERYERLKERQAAQREREEYRKMRRGVEKNVKALLKWIDTPTDTYHLPENMLAGVKEFLLKLDTSDDEITLKQEDFRRAQEAIKKLEPDEKGNADFYIEYDEQIEEMLQYLIDMFPKTGKNQVRLADLTAAEMRDLRDITNSMKRAIMDANRFISMGRNASISSIAESYIQETEKRKAARQAGTIRQISDFFNLDMMDAPSFFKSMGTGIYNTIYKGFREGFNQKINHVEEARAKMAEIADEKTIRRWRKAGAKEFTVQTADGKEVRIYLTIPQIMSLYCLTRRRQGKNHLDTGGFTIEQDKYGRKIMREEWQETLEQEETPEKKAERRKAWEAAQKAAKRRGKDAARQYEAVQTSAAEIARITETLTAEQKEAAEAIQEYLSSDVARWGNETSMLLYGYRKFTERHYFPIEGDKDFINAEYGADKKKRTLARMGITRHIIREAKNPLILKDIFSVYAKHIDQMTSYNAFVPVLSDLNKLLNYKILPSGEGVQQIQSMRKSITRVMGPKGINYISNLMDRINGAANGDDTAALPKMFLRNMKIASVGANARVIIQQPVSYLRAADVISPKYLFAAFGAGKNDFQRIYQYAPIARWKDWGNYEMNIGRSIEEMMAGQSYFQKFMEGTMYFAGWADRRCWGRIWKAVELETKKKQPELAPDSDRFYRAVGERFTEIIDETQVVDSILHRSQLMRSKSMFNQMATSFMSEPTKTYNMFRNSLVNFYAERTPENGKRMMRTFLTLTANGIGVAILAGFVDAVRDDEDDDFFEKWRRAVVGDYKDAETPKEKLLAALGSNLNDNFNPMNYIPFLRDLLSAVQGYDVKRTDFSWAADILKNAQEWDKFMKGESRYTFSAMLLETAGSISKLTGIPINSAKRDIFAIKDSFINHILGPDIQYENEKLKYFIGSERNTADYVKRMLEAKLDGNEELATKVYNDMIKAGISAETMENQLDSREKDRLRMEAEAEAAADAFWKEDFSDYMNQRDALGEKGYKEDNIESVIREITKKKYGEEAVETFDEISSDFWSEEEKAEKKDFQMTIDGMIEAKLAGKKEEATRLYNYMVGKGISNEKLDNAIESGEKKRVQEEPLAKEGAEAFHEGDIDRYTDIIDRLHEKGYFRGNAEKGVKTLYNKIYKGEEEEGFEEIKGDYWEEELEPDEMDYEMMANAYLYGDISDYNEAWAALEAQGKKKVNGGKTSMKSRMKKAYHEAKASGDYKKAEKARKEYLRLGGKAEKLLEQG